MDEESLLPFDLPTIARKRVSAAFDGGRITSDGGVMLLAQAERRLRIADRLAGVIPDGRDASRITHLLPDILRARIFAIACGYEDADDLDRLRFDPALKLACGRLPDSGRDLCSQPTVSRWENAPSLRDLIRPMGVMVDLYCGSYMTPPEAVTLDIDDTVDVVHGHQQLSLFNAHYDERCFLPIHVYDTATSRPVAVLLRPGKTPGGFRDSRSSAPPDPPHPEALATDSVHHPGRRALWPPGGHGMVRRERRRLHLWPPRQHRTRPRCR